MISLRSAELDVPNRAAPFKREKQIWVVGNIPEMKIPAGKTITSYTRPKPQRQQGKVRSILP